MAQVISATATFSRSGTVGKRVRFLDQAHSLLGTARIEAAAGRYDQAVEFAYRASLRVAGAWVAGSAVSKRKRLPASAWEQLALVKGPAELWVDKFRTFAKLRSRLVSGLEDGVSAELALELIALASEFLYAVEDPGSVPVAA